MSLQSVYPQLVTPYSTTSNWLSELIPYFIYESQQEIKKNKVQILQGKSQ